MANGCKGGVRTYVRDKERTSLLHEPAQLFSASIPHGAGEKYRHPVLTGGVKEIVYGTIRDIFLEKGLVILEMNGEADHVHVLFEADPFTAPGSLVNIVKTKTSRFARKEYGETVLKKYHWKPYFWSDSYFVTTVSENSLAVVRDYIRNQ